MELDTLPSTSNSETRISILGAGNYGRALALRFREAGLPFCFGSNKLKEDGNTGSGLMSYEDAVSSTDVVFLAIPSHAHINVCEGLKKSLEEKVLVDISNLNSRNDESNALRLKEMLPLSHIVKALNTVSAYTLENLAYGASRDTYICGDSAVAKEKVMQILRQIGLNPIDKGALLSAVMIEKLPLKFFPGWGTAFIITLGTLIPIWFYVYLRFFWYQTEEQIKQQRPDLGLYRPNRIIAWTMFWVLGLTYLPGILAGFIQIYRGTKYSRFPSWLDNWMKCRKQLGLICLLLASMHGCMSCLLMGAGELFYAVKRITIQIPGSKSPIYVYQQMPGVIQVSLLFAVLAVALMGIVGITSLPSVNARMSWMEWDFIQRGFGFTSLVFGFIHVMLYVRVLWNPDTKLDDFPPGAFIMPMFPLIVIFLKFLLMFPGLSCYLNRIRKGKIGYKDSPINNNSKPMHA